MINNMASSFLKAFKLSLISVCLLFNFIDFIGSESRVVMLSIEVDKENYKPQVHSLLY